MGFRPRFYFSQYIHYKKTPSCRDEEDIWVESNSYQTRVLEYFKKLDQT